SPPVVGGRPVQGVISSPGTDHQQTVEFLWEIKGVPRQTIRDFVRENTFRPEGTGQVMRVRVLDPVLLLHGKIRKIRNAVRNFSSRCRWGGVCMVSGRGRDALCPCVNSTMAVITAL